jgi:hypothetical protein
MQLVGVPPKVLRYKEQGIFCNRNKAPKLKYYIFKLRELGNFSNEHGHRHPWQTEIFVKISFVYLNIGYRLSLRKQWVYISKLIKIN